MKSVLVLRLVVVAAVVVGLANIATGCAHTAPSPPHVDPLAGPRAALRDVATRPLAADFAPEARLVLSRRLIADEVERALHDGLRVVADLELALPFVGNVALRPTVDVDSVDAERATVAGCDGCIVLTIDVSGLLTAQSSGFALPPVPWRGRARGPVALETITLDDGRRELRARLVTTAAADRGWVVDVEVDGFEQLGPTINRLAADQLRKLVADDDTPALPLTTLPKDVARRLRGIRAGADRGAVVVDLAFVAVAPGVVDATAPVAEDGFAIVVPDATVAAVVNATLLEMPVRDGWSALVTGFAVDGSVFDLDLDVFKDKRVEPYKVRAHGHVVVDGADGAPVNLARDGLGLVVERVDHRGAAPKGFDPIDGIVRGEIVRHVEQALQQIGVASTVLPDRRVLRLRGVRDHGSVIEVVGGIDDASSGS